MFIRAEQEVEESEGLLNPTTALPPKDGKTSVPNRMLHFPQTTDDGIYSRMDSPPEKTTEPPILHFV